MLTEEILKEHLITAYFIDNERQNIEVLTRSQDGKKVIPTIIPFDNNNPDYLNLTKFINLDQLHELTYQKNKKEKELFENQIIEIAKRDGLLTDHTKLDSSFFKTLVETIFKEEENEDHLFALKLALFEVEKIINSSNDELKKKLRQAKTKVEALQVAIELIK